MFDQRLVRVRHVVPLAGSPYVLDAGTSTAVIRVPLMTVRATGEAARDLIRPVSWALAFVAAFTGGAMAGHYIAKHKQASKRSR